MRERDPNLVKYEKRAIYVIFGLFISFALVSMMIGGDGFTGRIEDGVYYVATRDEYTAVSPLTYYFSITLGSLALGGMVLLVPYKIIMNLYHGRKT